MKPSIKCAVLITSQNKGVASLGECGIKFGLGSLCSSFTSSVLVLPSAEEKSIEVSFTGEMLLWKQKIWLRLFYFLLSPLPRSAALWWLKANDGCPPPSHLEPLLKVLGCFKSRHMSVGKKINWFSSSFLLCALPKIFCFLIVFCSVSCYLSVYPFIPRRSLLLYCPPPPHTLHPSTLHPLSPATGWCMVPVSTWINGTPVVLI